MPASKITRDDALARISDVFRAHGYDGASLSLFSQATGLGRASLYHHFPGGKEAMAREVFAHVGELVGPVLGQLTGAGTPAARLNRHLQGVKAFYAGGAKNCLLGVVALGSGCALFTDELRGMFRAWIDALAQLAQEAGATPAEATRRAEAAVAQIQGGLILARALGEDAPFHRVLYTLPALVLGES